MMDQPCKSNWRASALQTLAQDDGDLLSYKLCLPRPFLPNQPPKVKWVNWRWPRYEYNTQLPNVRACSQWLVHEGAVLNQFVLENSGEQSVPFNYRFAKRIWIRDLDYLDFHYPFNWALGKYSLIPGPNGYGHVCVHELNHDAAATARAASKPAGEDPKLSVDIDEPIKSPGSVAIIINLFINGKAAILGDEDIWHEHTVGGSYVGPNGAVCGTFEIIVAYKFVLLPDRPVHWRNFLVPAQDADVSKILHQESERLWENSGIPSLCSLGLSCVEPTEKASPILEDTDAERDGLFNAGTEGTKIPGDHSNAESGQLEANVAVNTQESGTALSSKNASPSDTPDHSHHNPISEPMGSSLPSGTLKPGSSPKLHIEYFAWRHLEYVLSVCAVPTLVPKLFEHQSTGQPGHVRGSPTVSREEEAKADDALVALTCGDMSGHLVCASAGL